MPHTQLQARVRVSTVVLIQNKIFTVDELSKDVVYANVKHTAWRYVVTYN